MKVLATVATVLMSLSCCLQRPHRPALQRPFDISATTRFLPPWPKADRSLQDPGLAIVAGRSAPSAAAIDPTTHHIFLIQEGEAALVTGGKLAGKAIEGGQNRRLKTGDMMVIPAKTPYWWKEVPSGTVGYLAVNKETPQSGNTWGLPDVVQLINANRIKTRMTEPEDPPILY